MNQLLLTFFLFFSLQLNAGKVDTISIYSNAMQKVIKSVVITPDVYERANEKFPVVYLLHGYSANYAQWINAAPQLQQKADELNMILVCPDGGFNSWYFNSPVDSNVKYETFISKELVSYMDHNYKTISNKNGRAVTGLSMGGHGGLYLSIKHKDVFGAAGSICGGVDIRPFPNNWDLQKQLGDTVCCKQNWKTHTVINLVDELKNGELKLIIDCGLGDFFLEVNRTLHQKLMSLNIDHDYIERPGMHNKEYWGSAIDYHLLFFRKWFGVAE